MIPFYLELIMKRRLRKWKDLWGTSVVWLSSSSRWTRLLHPPLVCHIPNPPHSLSAPPGHCSLRLSGLQSLQPSGHLPPFSFFPLAFLSQRIKWEFKCLFALKKKKKQCIFHLYMLVGMGNSGKIKNDFCVSRPWTNKIDISWAKVNGLTVHVASLPEYKMGQIYMRIQRRG